jgi:hypothetical protein
MREDADIDAVRFEGGAGRHGTARVIRDDDLHLGAFLIARRDLDPILVAAQYHPGEGERLLVEVEAGRGADDHPAAAILATPNSGNDVGRVGEPLQGAARLEEVAAVLRDVLFDHLDLCQRRNRLRRYFVGELDHLEGIDP